MNKLLSAFQQFFREHAESWIERFQYKEAGPQLLLQAFLQRIVDGIAWEERIFHRMESCRQYVIQVWGM